MKNITLMITISCQDDAPNRCGFDFFKNIAEHTPSEVSLNDVETTTKNRSEVRLQ